MCARRAVPVLAAILLGLGVQAAGAAPACVSGWETSGLICRQGGSGRRQAAQRRVTGGVHSQQLGMEGSAAACRVTQQRAVPPGPGHAAQHC